jgi:parallel beta-helix repeat protein
MNYPFMQLNLSQQELIVEKRLFPNAMRRVAVNCLTSVLIVLFSLQATAQYTTQGICTQSGDIFNLAAVSQSPYAGRFWKNTKIDLNNDFTLNFNLKIGDPLNNGVAFVLQRTSLTPSIAISTDNIQNFGTGSIANDFVVEFDIRGSFCTSGQNTSYEPITDINHVSYWKNNSVCAFGNYYSPYSALGTIDNYNFQPYKIKWTKNTNTLETYFNNVLIKSNVIDLIGALGGADVWWGFSSGCYCVPNYPQVQIVDPVATVTTTSASSITTSGFASGGNVTSDGGDPVTARGVAYGTSATPTIADNATSNGTGTGVFTSTITGLSANTQYFYRAYATNSSTVYGSESSLYTLANIPVAPVLNNATTTTLDIAIGSGDNNPATTQYAILFESGSYVQADGTISSAPVWQTAAAWGTTTIHGFVIVSNGNYDFEVKARNTAGVETPIGPFAALTTLAITPGAPTVNGATTSSLNVTINPNGNSSFTTMAIHETTTNKYVQANGSLGNSPVWQTASVWGTKTVTGLTASTLYTFETKAINQDNVETTFGPSASASTTCLAFVHNINTGQNYCSIQAAINDPLTLNTHVISIDAGTYAEDVVVTKELEIKGAGALSTTIIPATSVPNTGGGSLGGTNVFLIQANNVKIHDLGINGNNPALTSGEVFGGQDIDARNGIITNHAAGVYTNLQVYNTNVKNIWLRGIYQSSGGTFNFHDNTVANVQASQSSIAMFAFGSSGVFDHNTVSDANDAISANNSTGIVFSNNTITNSASGIHSDNNGSGGGVADEIFGNTVSNSSVNGFGIWVFAPYRNVWVHDNKVNNVDVGMAMAGQQAAVTPVFERNEIDGQGKANSTGMYVTTSLFGFGSSNVTVNFNNNIVKNNTASGFLLESENGQTLTINAHENSITGNSPSAVQEGFGSSSGFGTFTTDMTCNWWGTTVYTDIAAAIPASVNYIPYLVNGTDNDLVTSGFQPVSGSCTGRPTEYFVNDNSTADDVYTTAVGDDANPGTAAAPFATIQHAINAAVAGNNIWIDAGTYIEQVNVNKSLTITGAGRLGQHQTTIKAPATLTTVTNANASGHRPIVYVFGTTNTTDISKVNIDGDGRGGDKFYGVYYFEASGSFSDSRIAKVRDASFSGVQSGQAFFANHSFDTDVDQTVTVNSNIIEDYQKTGVLINELNTHGIVTDNIITGQNIPNVNGQNGIQFGYGAYGTITGNIITNNLYNGVSADVATGILLAGAGVDFNNAPTGNTTTIGSNILSGNEAGLFTDAGGFGYDSNAGVTYDVNTFSNNYIHVSHNAPASVPNPANVYDKRVDNLSKTNTVYGKIQRAVDDAVAGNILHAGAGIFDEDVIINKSLTLTGTGAASSTIRGVIGGSGSTVAIAANNSELSGFTITRSGNTVADWNNGGNNTAGVSVQGSITGMLIHDNIITQNRTGIDVNNSSGHTMRNNIITDNNTGLVFRNQTDNITLTENEIIANRTVGILFLDGSGGTNTPAQTAANCNFFNNNISGNWYGQIVDRQTGGSLPAPGGSLKNFSGNWFGTNIPVVTTANSAEPGYATHIPVEFGGTATPPAAQPDIAGPASANFDYTPYLNAGTDVNIETVPGRGTFGFQGSFSNLWVTAASAQTGATTRIQEGVNLVSGSIVNVTAGTYNENVVINTPLTLQGAGNTTILTPLSACSGNGITINANNTIVKNLKVTNYTYGIVVAGSSVELNTIESVSNCVAGIELGNGINGLTVKNSKINSNTQIGIRAGTTAQMSNITIDNCEVKGNLLQGMYIAATASGSNSFDNISIKNSDFSNNAQKGMYFEKLSNAVIDNITMNNSGTDATNGFNNGIDINLKYGNYSNITIKNSSFTNCGANGTSAAVDNASAITIKGRDDAPSYNSVPATLTGVTVMNNFIHGPQNGIRFGEVGKTNATPTNVSVTENDFGNAFANKALINLTTNSITNATCNWYGTVAPGAVAALITGAVTYSPYLTNGTDNNVAAGFQPVPANCNAVNDLYVNDNSITGDHYTNATGSDVTGTGSQSAPYATLQKAISVAAPGNKIWVDAGTYALTSAIGVDKKLTLFGSQGGVDARTRGVVAESIIDASALSAFPPTAFDVKTSANESVIDGFTIQGAQGVQALGGIWLETGSNGTVIQNNIIQENTSGIFLANNSAVRQTQIIQNLFRDNTIAGPSSGSSIYADEFTTGTNLQNVLIKDNVFTNTSTVVNTWAIGLSNTSATPWTNITIQDNKVNNHGRGLYFYGTSNSTVSGNTFTGATNYAIGIFDGGVSNSLLTITNNILTNNFRGIWVDETTIPAYNGTLAPTGNIFTGGTYDLVNSATAGTPAFIDAVNNTYDGVVLDGSTSLTNIFSIADKVLDAVDVSNYGKINLRAGNQYVTVNSFYTDGGTTSPKIQRSVDAALATNIVNVGPGVFTEQVEIAKDLTVLGQGVGVTTILSPNTLALSYTTSAVNKPIVFVHDAANVVIKAVTVDGDGKGNTNNRFQGIAYWNAGGTVQDNEIKAIRNNPIDGAQAGTGIYASATNATTRTLNILHNTISGFQKGGLVCIGNNLSAAVDNNTVTGAGTVNFIAQNGIQLSDGATGSITNNIVSGYSYAPATFASAGILVYGASGSIATSGNTVNNAQVGIWYYESGGNITANTINYNAGSMGATPYWYGIDVENGATLVNQNTVNGAGNGAGIETDYVIGETTAVTAINNFVDNTDEGFSIWTDGSGGTANSTITNNSITNSISFAIHNYGAINQTATCNWYGTANAPTVGSLISGPVVYSPYLFSGTDNQPGTPGFQPVPGTCNSATIVLSETHADASCYGTSTGSIDLTVSDGTAPYTFAWTRTGGGFSAMTEDLANIPAGEYSVLVTDANGITATLTVTIIQPSAIPVPTVSVVDNCNGTSTLTASGFTGVLTWSNSGSDNPHVVNSAGSYTVTQTVGGCTSASSIPVNASPKTTPPAPSIISVVDNCNGTSALTASGFTGVLTWSNGGNDNPHVVNSAGSYTVTQTINSCTSLSSTPVTASPKTPPLAPTVNVANNCNGTSTLTASGYTGLLAWSNGGSDNPHVVTIAGSYTVTQIVNGCTSPPSTPVTAAPGTASTPLSISCPPNISISSFPGICSAILLFPGLPTISGGCGGLLTISNNHPSIFYAPGVTNITWTVSDGHGNSASCIQKVTVVDDQDPVLDCPSNITQTISNNNCSKNISVPDPNFSDNCEVTKLTWVMTGATTANSSSTGMNYVGSRSFNVGITTITYTAKDASGNTSTCSFTVKVKETQAPTISCPSNKTVNADAGQCYATNVNLGNPTVHDNCGVASVTNDAPAQFQVGVTHVTWTVTDNSGNTASCTQNVTVTASITLNISCPPSVNVNTDPGQCYATNVNLGTPVTTGCGVLTVTNNAPSQFPVGVTTVTWKLKDANGNSKTCTQTVTVTGGVSLSISCPPNKTVSANAGKCYATNVNLGTPVTTGCGSLTITNDAPSQFPVGITTVTWKVKDANGNSKTCTQTVTVTGGVSLSISCPSNKTVNANNGQCYATNVNLGTPTTTGCGTLTVTNNAPSQFPVGVTIVTWTVKDASNNTQTCTQTVTVTGGATLSIICPANKTVNADAGQCYATNVNLGTPSTTGCGVLTITNDVPAQFPVGTTTVNWKVKDNNGNTRTCTQNVTVTGGASLSISCPPNKTVNANTGQCYATNVSLGTPTTTGCGTLTITNNAPLQFPLGTTMVTWKVKDANGNSKTCSQSVTVVDNQVPVVTCPANITQNAPNGQCGKNISVPNPWTSDNCGIVKQTWSMTGATNGNSSSNGINTVGSKYFNCGYTTITYKVWDASNNTSTCSFTVNLIGGANCAGNTRLLTGNNENQHPGYMEETKMQLTVFPNPTEDYFNLKVKTQSKEAVEIRVFDMLGKLVDVMRGSPEQTYRFGDHVTSGMYMVEVRQQGQIATVKVVKQ